MSNFITCVKSRGVDVKKNYLGNTINNADIYTTQLEIFFNNSSANAHLGDITAWVAELNSWLHIGEIQTNLTIHGVTFTNARIISVDTAPTPDGMNNAILRGSINITVEERFAGDTTRLSHDSQNYSNLGSLLDDVKDISEDISYNLGVNGQFSMSHSVTVSLKDGYASASKDGGLQIAKSILDSYLPTASAGLANGSSIHNALVGNGATGYLSASVNQITGECTYSRSVDVNYPDAYYETNNERSHSLTLDKQGIIKVTESGRILPLSVDDYPNASSMLTTILSGAQARCSSVFSNYVSKLDNTLTNAANAMGSIAVETVKTFNEISHEVSYSVSYSNDPNILNGHTIDRTTDISQDKSGIATLTEKTSFIQHSSKCVTDPLVLYTDDNGGAWARAIAVYNTVNGSSNLEGGAGFAFKLASRTLNYNPNGKNLSYSFSWTSDPSISASGSAAETATIKKMSIDWNDKLPERMRQEYPIAPIGLLVHDPGQTSLGTRTVSVTANLDRDNCPYTLFSPARPNAAISYMADIVKDKILDVFIDLNLGQDDIYITECNYSFNSNRTVTLSATAQYLQAR
jgi:hypothetical protein